MTPSAHRLSLRGVEWAPEALEDALAVAKGYPYFIQAVGKHVWDAALASPITRDDVAIGGALARAEVDEGLYKSRWERATPAQRELMRTLADLAGDGAAQISELASRMDRKTTDLSVSRGQLIAKGLVYALSEDSWRSRFLACMTSSPDRTDLPMARWPSPAGHRLA